MLTLLAHTGAAPTPETLWALWGPSVPLAVALAGLLWLHRRGRGTARPNRRGLAFVAGVAAVTMAVLSPLETAAAALASAHMVQHLLLTLVAAPLLAAAGAGPALLRGLPRAVVRVLGRLPHRVVTAARRAGMVLRNPALVWLLHVTTVWVWHSARAYIAAVGSEFWHAVEHGLFLGTAFLVWRLVVGPKQLRAPPTAQLGIMFGLSLQGVFLAALLTFASQPWYQVYAQTTTAWGLSALDDQRLAGLLMWVPGGLVYLIVALRLLARWLRHLEDPEVSAGSGITVGTGTLPGRIRPG